MIDAETGGMLSDKRDLGKGTAKESPQTAPHLPMVENPAPPLVRDD